jgi:AcrR family transcriptional regulator
MADRPDCSETTSRIRYHHGDLREALIRATEQLVTELGPEAVSVRAAARRAGVSSGAPFHHFPTRQALMTAVAEAATRRLRQRIEAAIADVPASDAFGRLQAMGRAYLGWVVENPARFIIVSDRRLFAYSASIDADNVAIQSSMREILQQAIARENAMNIDIDQTLLAMRAMAYGLARMLVDGHLPQWGIAEVCPLARMETLLGALLPQLMVRRTAWKS